MAITLTEPFGEDNVTLHSMALEWIKLGRVPYIGSWDNNFPGIIYVHALSILLFGSSDVAFRFLDLIVEVAFAAFFYRFLKRWLQPHAAALSAILAVAIYVSSGVDVYGKQDTYGMMAIVLATAIYLPTNTESRPKVSNVVLAGALAGISLLMRPTFLLFVGLSTLFIFLLFRKDVFQAISTSIAFGFSSLIAPGLVVLYYSTIPGGIVQLYNSLIGFNTQLYVSLASGAKLWWEIGRSGLAIPLALYALFARGERSFVVRKPITIERVVYVSYLAGIFGVMLLMGKYYRYHLAPFFLLLTPLSACGIELLRQKISKDVRRHVLMIGCVVCCSFITYNPTAPIAFAFGALEKQDPFVTAERARNADTMYGFVPISHVREYIARTGERATVEVCSFSPTLRYRLGRPAVGPYISLHPIAFRKDATRVGWPVYADFQKKWQQDYVETLKKAKPDFIVMARHQKFWYIRDVYDDCLHYLPGFDSLLTTSYQFDTSFGAYQIYRCLVK